RTAIIVHPYAVQSPGLLSARGGVPHLSPLPELRDTLRGRLVQVCVGGMLMGSKSEFTVANTYHYNQSGPKRWIISHLARYKLILFGFVLLALLTNVCYALIPTLAGTAFTVVLQRQIGLLGLIALALLGVAIAQAALELGSGFLSEVLSKR